MIGQILITAGLLAASAALLPGSRRHLLIWSATVSHLLAVCWLLSRFIFDDFAYRQVWLQSDPNLDWWLKLAGPWSGDEGTLLLMALLAAGFAVRLAQDSFAAMAGAAALSAVFAAGALYWSPFQMTSTAELTAASYNGMNAHLTSVWMLVHPPLIFVSYMLVIAPVGAMVAAIANGDPAWRAIAGRYGRLGWLLISAGIGFGMWWAYEDFTYGTLWHWDPVQTAIFAVWCFLTAMLHLQGRYRPKGAFAVLHPLLGLFTAASAMLVMAITRSDQLASSHRYVGNTSLWLLSGVAVAILLAGVAAYIWRLHRDRASRNRANAPAVLWMTALLFTACGVISLFHLAEAFTGAYFGLPRPDDLKPFFETLRAFASANELSALRAAFAQWEVDNFAMNGWLAPVLTMSAIMGGHLILPFTHRRRWVCTGIALLTVFIFVGWLQPFERLYDGRGLTSGKTVAQFAMLDGFVAALLYLLFAIGAVLHSRLKQRQGAMSVPVAFVHVGALVALIGGLSATVFDSYTQRFINIPDDLGREHAFAGGYSVTIGAVSSDLAPDGARGAAEQGAFQTLGEVSWSLQRDGLMVDGGSGHTVYRDVRSDATQGTGAVRLMCEAIDYRFARYRSGDSQMIHPLISRGLLQDVQIWLPAALPDAPSAKTPARAPIVLKTFPLMSLVWVGLILCAVGAGWHTLWAFIKERRLSSAS